MARSSTTFTKQTAPKGNKGKKHRRTVIKQAVGVKNWDSLKEWIETKGIKQATAELQKLKGKDFIYAYEALLEYVKPKLSRTTVAGDKDNPVQHELKLTIVKSDVPIAENEEDVR